MSTLSRTAADATLKVEDPRFIPAGRYHDEAFFAAERERLWPRAWQMACRVEQLPDIGDWTEYTILGHSIVVVRAEDGIYAFHNACRHRGVALVEGHGNCRTKGFICPFHGWRWNLRGENTFVYGRHFFDAEVLAGDEIALRRCRVELAMGCVFINFSDDAPSLREQLGPLVERLEAHNVERLRAEWWVATVLPANWKTAMEAFMEGFHVMRTHPQLQQVLPALYNSRYGSETGGLGVPINPGLSVRENLQAQVEHMHLIAEGMSGQCHAKEVAIARDMLDIDLPDDPIQAVPLWFGMLQEEITHRLRAGGEPVPDLNAVAQSHPLEAVEFVFPNYFLLSFFTSMASYRVRPLGPETCLFELWSLTFFPEGEEPEPPRAPRMLPYDSEEFPLIPRQDYANIPRQQIGLKSTGFEHMRLARNVEGLISNYQRLIDGYLEGRDEASLLAAHHSLASTFDGAIRDYGW